MTSSLAENLALELLTGGTNFLKSRRDDHRTGNAGLAALPDQRRGRAGRSNNHCQVNLTRHCGDVREGFDPKHVFPFRIDRVDRSLESAALKIFQHGAT